MKDSRTVEQVISDNHKHFMKRGPALSYAYGIYVIAKDTKNKRVFIGGLGSCGVGRMWVNMTDDLRHEDYAGWEDAEEQSE